MTNKTIQNETNINSLIMLNQKIIDESKRRDLFTFVIMCSCVLMIVPIINFLAAIANLIWMVFYIIIYFSIKKNKALLHKMLENLDKSQPFDKELNQNGMMDNPEISENWKAIFYNFDKPEIQELWTMREKRNRKRNRAAFIYMIVKVTIIISSFIAFAILAASSLNGQNMSDSKFLKFLGSLILVWILIGLIYLVNFIIWVSTYMFNVGEIKSINTEFMGMRITTTVVDSNPTSAPTSAIKQIDPNLTKLWTKPQPQ